MCWVEDENQVVYGHEGRVMVASRTIWRNPAAQRGTLWRPDAEYGIIDRTNLLSRSVNCRERDRERRRFPMSSSIPRTSGIYKIVCIPTGKLYVGSAVDLWDRWRTHRNQLTRRYGTPHANRYLQRAWDKYDKSAFEFVIIELVLAPFLLEREQYWLDKLMPFRQRGFNIARVAGSGYGVQWSDESRKKASITHTGKKIGPMSEEQKRKMSEARKGRDLGRWAGRTHRPETIEKMRQAKLGQPEHPNAALAKVEASSREYIVTDPNGREYHIKNLSLFCREHGLTSTSMIRLARGRLGVTQHKGWKCRYP
jgi:group I intron endonuclease